MRGCSGRAGISRRRWQCRGQPFRLLLVAVGQHFANALSERSIGTCESGEPYPAHLVVACAATIGDILEIDADQGSQLVPGGVGCFDHAAKLADEPVMR